VVQRDDPLAIALAHQTRIDPVLRMLRPIELVAADQLRRVRPQHLDPDVEEVQRAARVGRSAVVANVVIERALPVLLQLAARDEHDIRIREAFHVAAKVAAVPRGFHAADDGEDCLFLGFRIDSSSGLALRLQLARCNDSDEDNDGEGAQGRVSNHCGSRSIGTISGDVPD
jgi:hypothetical protein